MEPSALPRAHLPRGSRQDPEPGPCVPRCGPARSGRLAGRQAEAGGGSRAQARAARGRGCLHSAHSFPHARPPCSSWSIHLLGRGAGRKGWNRLLGGLGSNGTKLSLVVLRRSGAENYPAGSLGQNNDRLVLPPLHRANGQRGRPAWLASKAHLPGDWTFPFFFRAKCGRGFLA